MIPATGEHVCASGEGTENAPFPGVPVTALGVDENGWNFYMITLDRDVFTGVTFSGGTDETRTAELGLGEEGYIVYYVGSGNASVEADVWPGPGEEQEATCTEAGYTTHTCSRCGDSYSADDTFVLGHAWDAGEVIAAASHQASGEMKFTCTRCGETKTEEIPKLDNPFVDVHEGNYFFDPVMWALDESVTGGVGNGKFGVGQACTRGEIITFLYKAFSIEE